ncbi:hypothetical protein ACOSP7_001536 [Xanthoceras sorbifolium]|uniref:Uncharacterized protein n=1 Tax=Xanthoceras sorbifolium TaxID=99658 RepID=A0ABQ8ILG3_9ROSI|nr:hypothetical protein JRO89_XS01G0263900 [Xanthoceras sorbifolium]
MAASVDTQSPAHLDEDSTSFMGASPLYSDSPSSDKRFWSNLRGRIDSILEDRNSRASNGQNQLNIDPSLPTQENVRRPDRAKRLKEDSLLLLRGFDSVAQTLSQLSNNLDNALQGARVLAKPPTLTEIFQSNLKKSESKEEEDSRNQQNQEEKKKELKRKFDSSENSDDQGEDSQKEKESDPPKDKRMMKKAKNLAISMATKAASLARELKSLKSDLCFMQERCNLLEEENRRLRDGFDKGIRPEEDDLVRLQLEALLAEKSRLANDNSNLIRENQCLHQLVEYHQITSQDLSASYEEAIRGMCLDFSSPSSAIAEEPENVDDDNADFVSLQTPQKNIFGLSTSLDDCFQEEQG